MFISFKHFGVKAQAFSLPVEQYCPSSLVGGVFCHAVRNSEGRVCCASALSDEPVFQTVLKYGLEAQGYG